MGSQKVFLAVKSQSLGFYEKDFWDKNEFLVKLHGKQMWIASANMVDLKPNYVQYNQTMKKLGSPLRI